MLFDLPENPAAQYLHQEKARGQKGEKRGGGRKNPTAQYLHQEKVRW
jgi:hypothetical protein